MSDDSLPPDGGTIDTSRLADILAVLPRARYDLLVATLVGEVVALGHGDGGPAVLHRLRGSAATLGLTGLARGLDHAEAAVARGKALPAGLADLAIAAAAAVQASGAA
ncbi:hypothetical protein IP88_12105 [alpha proteobacterium AAP81b]|nr:hypothetical protein IP88_12105 [alpha proteobacterium AAP81b]